MPAKPVYEVVSPLGKQVSERIASVPAISSLEGKKIGFIWNGFANGGVLNEAFMDLLEKRHIKGLKLVKLTSGKTLDWGEHPDKSVGAVVKESGVDAVVVTMGC